MPVTDRHIRVVPFDHAGEDFSQVVMLSASTGPDQAADASPDDNAPDLTVGDTVTWTSSGGSKTSGKVVKIVTTGQLKPPVGPPIDAPAVLVQVGSAKVALPADKVSKTTAASAAVAIETGSPNDVLGGLAPTVTMHDIEFCRVGTFQASTGPATITREDLESMLAAAADPEVDRAPVHPGHYDARFAVGDGEPALGWAVPRRIEGDRLIGDFVDVPTKVAAIIPKAYPRRSVEMAYNVKGASENRHKAVLTGMALLGVKAPAIKGMADVVARYSAGNEEYDVVEFAVGEELTHDTPDDTTASPNSESPSEHDQSQSVTAAETTGGTVPRPKFTNDRVAALLGLPADDPAIAKVQSALTEDEPAADGTPAPVAAGEGTPAASTDAAGTPAAPAAGTPAPAAPAAAPVEDRQPVAASAGFQLPEGTVMLSQGQFDELMQKANAGAQAAEVIASQRRDEIIRVALSEGKITVAEANGDPEKKVKGFREQLDENEAAVVALFSSLTPGRVPVTPQGHQAPGEQATDAEKAAEDAMYANFSERVLGIKAPAAQ